MSDAEARLFQEQLVEAQRLEVAGRLASGVAHNFNNMLLVILGNASLALSVLDRADGDRLPHLRHYIEGIAEAGERASAVVRQLMRFSHEEENTMNWNQVEGNWEQFKGKVQNQWGKLTGDDLDVIKGKRKELSGKIQERYGKAQEDADKEVDEWVNRLN